MLFPLKRSHLYSEFEGGKSTGGPIVYVRIFAVTGILILALACINFTNLATARSEKRAKEVGIRKTVRSYRKQLIFQFLSETVMMVAFALLAIVISCLGLYGLSAFAAERRTKEVGIRKVMGATLYNIVALFSRDFSKLVLTAFLLSAPLTWWIMDRWLQQYSFRKKSNGG